MNTRDEVNRIQAEEGLTDQTVIGLLCDFIDDDTEQDLKQYLEQRAKGE
jgi:hypothetical protein